MAISLGIYPIFRETHVFFMFLYMFQPCSTCEVAQPLPGCVAEEFHAWGKVCGSDACVEEEEEDLAQFLGSWNRFGPFGEGFLLLVGWEMFGTMEF